MTDMTFFGNPDCLLPCPADKNKVLRQFFFNCAERTQGAGFYTQWFANSGKCTIMPGRLVVVWNEFGSNDIVHEYAKRAYDVIYGVLKEQERRMISRQLRCYSLALDIQRKALRLELLIPMWWPELYFWAPTVGLRELVQNLAGKDAK